MVFRRGRLEQVVVAARLLEELPEVVLAVEDPIEGCVRGGRQETATVSALEAGLVVWLALQSHLRRNWNYEAGFCNWKTRAI